MQLVIHEQPSSTATALATLIDMFNVAKARSQSPTYGEVRVDPAWAITQFEH